MQQFQYFFLFKNMAESIKIFQYFLYKDPYFDYMLERYFSDYICNIHFFFYQRMRI